MSSNPTSTIPVDVRRFPWIRRLAADYAFDFPRVAPFFAGNPADRGAWADAVARTQACARGRTEIAAVVAAQQARRHAPAAAVEAGARLADARTVAIVTGQQAGLFGGPLFTLLKAITALKLAEEVSREQHVPAVAVFWIDAEDHDWEEVRSCTVFDDQFAPRAVELPARDGADAPSVGSIALDEAIVGVIDELERTMPPTEFRAPVIADLRRIYKPGAGMADAFGCWLEHVLGDRGLIVYDASDRASKPLASPVFARELSTAGTTTSLAAAAGTRLTSDGYHAQVSPQDGSLALFQYGNDGHAHARRSVRPDEAGALARDAAERPDHFSPNVLLRPIVQDTLFPTVCYVAGPNELAYLAQLRGVYEHFKLPMPLMYPRASATILDSAGMRFLNKTGLPLEALQAQDEAALNELLQRQIPPQVEASFADATRTIEDQMARVVEAVPAIDPTLQGAAKSTLARMQHDLETLHGKMIQAAKRRDDTLRRQFVHARALAFPGGHAQERTIGFLAFLNQYGPALVARLHEELPLDMGRHWIVTI